jgi:transcription elongation factor GreB
VRNQHGEQTVYRIVGKDETDTDRNCISWTSPIAKALLKAHVGDHVRFRAPEGEQDLEITGIRYE